MCYLILDCRGLRLADEIIEDGAAAFNFDVTGISHGDDRQYVVFIQFYRGSCFCQIEEDPDFSADFEGLLRMLSGYADEVYYCPNAYKWRGIDALELSPAEIATRLKPMSSESALVRVKRQPSCYPKLSEHLSGHPYGMPVNVFSGDGCRLLTVPDTGTAHVWDLDSQQQVGEIVACSPRQGRPLYPDSERLFETYIEAAALNQDGSLALLGLNDGSASLYTTTGERLLLLTEPGAEEEREHFRQTRAVAISPDGSLLAVGFFGRKIAIWTITGALHSTLQHPLGEGSVADGCRQTLASSLAFSPDSEHLFAGFGDYTGGVWEVATGRFLADASASGAKIVGVRVHDESVLWATSEGRVWNGSGRVVKLLLEAKESWLEATIDVNGQSLIAHTDKGAIKRWSWDDGSTLLGEAEVEQGLRDFKDDITLLYSSPSSGLRIYPRTAERLLVSSASGVRELEGTLPLKRIVVSKNERSLLVHRYAPHRTGIHGERLTEVVDLAKGTAVEMNGGHVLSPDGNWLVCQSRNPKNTVELWCTEKGECVRRLRIDNNVAKVVFSADSRNLVTTSRRGFVSLLRLGPGPRFRRSDDSASRTTKSRRFRDLDFKSLSALSGDRLIISRRGGLEIWQGLDYRIARLDVPSVSRWQSRRWWLSDDESTLAVEINALQFQLFSTCDGRRVATYDAPMVRPLALPVGNVFWRLEGHVYHHQGDYLRGGFRTLPVSFDERFLLTDCLTATNLIDLEEPTRIAQRLPFCGSFRAGWIGKDEVRILEATGRIFRFPRRSDEVS